MVHVTERKRDDGDAFFVSDVQEWHIASLDPNEHSILQRVLL